jgi:hypothetical protein
MGNDLMRELALALAPEIAKLGVKGATGTPTTYYNNGPGGLFATAGQNQDVISTVVTPQGILDVLPAFPTVYMNPIFSYVTGFRADTGDEAATVCDNCKTAGIIKACRQTAAFGRYCRETREISVERLFQRIDRSEPGDLRLLNSPLSNGNSMIPSRTRGNPLASEIQRALVEVGVSFERLLAQQVWQGNPANGNVGGGYSEFPGLDILIATGKVDAITGTSCPSLDPDIKDFNYQDVCSGSSPSIVETLTYLYRYCSKNARTMNLDPVDFRFAMREELFYELTSCWPCSYLTFRCTSSSTGNAVPQIDSTDAITMRDAMRNGRYLVIDGKQVPVILDDGIAEDTNTNNANLAAGEFASDIYLLPFSVKGNFSSLYMEYLDFSKAQPDINLAGFQSIYDVTDGGKFLWIKDNVRGCFLLQGVIRPRVILLTPQLAGRVTNVKYEPLQHTREPFPTDGYFVNGGVVTTTDRGLYHEWTDPSDPQ